MAIKVVNDSNFADPEFVTFSEGGSFTEPIRLVKNNSVSGDITLDLYLRNDSIDEYTDLTIQPVPDSLVGTSASKGWQMKILSGVNGVPAESDWDGATAGGTLSYDDDNHKPLGIYTFPGNTGPDVNYAYPFHVRLIIPAGSPVQTTRGVSLKVDYT